MKATSAEETFIAPSLAVKPWCTKCATTGSDFILTYWSGKARKSNSDSMDLLNESRR